VKKKSEQQMNIKITAWAAAAFLLVAPACVSAAEITVVAGMGNVSGINDLAAAFEKASGHKVVVRFVQAADLRRSSTPTRRRT
jgi:ABC-type molybdate transport system substrate-binding protein